MKRWSVAFHGLCFVFALGVQALEVDEKLTTRFLKVSRSKKTALLNRGLEDGLVVGDHARFFLTTGVIARGVAIRATPTRSIWSLYRIIDGDSIFPDRVVNIKITHPVRITQDASKSFKVPEGEVPAGVEVVAQNGQSPEDADELSSLEEGEEGGMNPQQGQTGGFLGAISDAGAETAEGGMGEMRTWEFYGLLHWGHLNARTDSDIDSSVATSSTDFGQGVGLEKYFTFTDHFLRNVSIRGILSLSNASAQALEGGSVSHSALEYGGGVSWHFMADPLSTHRLIGLADLAAGIGRTNNSSGNVQTEAQRELLGSSQFLRLGVGLKYYLPQGLGMRLLLSYYRRKESYIVGEDEEALNYSKILTGPRLQLGIAYRW